MLKWEEISNIRHALSGIINSIHLNNLTIRSILKTSSTPEGIIFDAINQNEKIKDRLMECIDLIDNFTINNEDE